MQELKKVLNKVDLENMAISIDECKTGCEEVEWLEFVINDFCTKPMLKKTEAITKLQHPTTFKQLKRLWYLFSI